MSDELFGHYRLGEIIGRGNVSEVHRAVDVRKERTVAVKLLRPELAADAGFPDRFRHEAALAAGLAAPHVIPIHDYGNIDAIFYVEMPLVEGPDLAGVLARQGPLAPEAAVRIVTQVADALDAGHAEGLVHGDVKPSNILLTGDALEFAYLTDFGLARSWTGTPEQDHEADIHALAGVLGVALGGSLAPTPVAGDATVRIVAAVPPALRDVVARGTATEPTDRFGTARELADAARAAIGPAPDPPNETALPAPAAVPVPVPPAPEPATEAVAALPVAALPVGTVPVGTADQPARRPISTRRALLIAAVVAALAVAVTLGLTAGRGIDAVAPAPPVLLVPTLAATLPIGADPGQAMIGGDGRRVFVPTAAGMAVLDTTGPLTGASISTTPLSGERSSPVGAFPHSGGILSPDGRRIYVPVVKPDARSGLDVLDTTTMRSTGFLAHANRPALIAALDISPDGTTLYASVIDVDTQPLGTVLKIIDTGTGAVVKEIPLGAGYAGVRVATPGATAFALRLALRDSPAGPTAAAVDLRGGTLGADLPVSFPIGMALSADRATAHVSVSGGFAVIDTAAGAVRRMVPLTSSRAFTAAITPDGRTLCYTTSAGVSVLDIASGTVTGSVAYRFTGSPGPISVAPDGRRAYVPDPGSDALLVVDLVPAS